jgi:hypothetical protein
LEADIEQQQHQYLEAGVVSSAVDDEDSDGVAVVGGQELGRRSWLSRVFRAAVPVHTLGFLLLGVAALWPLCLDDCSEANCFVYSLQPMLRYYDGLPPL